MAKKRRMEIEEGGKVPKVCYSLTPGIPEMNTLKVYKGEEEMEEGVDYNVKSNCIRLLHSLPQDSGTYAIVASNCIGSSNFSFHLRVTRSHGTPIYHHPHSSGPWCHLRCCYVLSCF